MFEAVTMLARGSKAGMSCIPSGQSFAQSQINSTQHAHSVRTCVFVKRNQQLEAFEQSIFHVRVCNASQLAPILGKACEQKPSVARRHRPYPTRQAQRERQAAWQRSARPEENHIQTLAELRR